VNESYIKNYLESVSGLVTEMPVKDIEEVARIILSCHGRGNQVFVIGNGGSAATASHFSCDLSKGTKIPGARWLKAVALTDNVPLLTAWANDTSYENVFSEQLAPLVVKDDVLLAISGSGNSPNIIKAVQFAKSTGAFTIGLAGFDGGALKKNAHFCLVVPGNNMQQVEDVHSVLCHLIASYVREAIKNESGLS